MLDTNARPIFELRGPMGIPIQVVPSFLMLAAVFCLFDPSVRSVGFFAMIAVSILLHEYGHAWGARVQGVPVSRIVMWGGGGLCYHGGTRDPRKRELIVAMGPLVNLALWAVASLASDQMYDVLERAQAQDHMSWEIAWQLHLFGRINLFLFALNLLPVSPLDGGRLLFLALCRFVPTAQAGRIAGALGLLVSVAWIPAMIWAFMTYGWLLLFIPSIGLHLQMMRGEALP